MTNDTQTPLTDAARGFFDLETAVSAEEMEKLERECARLREELAALKSHPVALNDLQALLGSVGAWTPELEAEILRFLVRYKSEAFKLADQQSEQLTTLRAAAGRVVELEKLYPLGNDYGDLQDRIHDLSASLTDDTTGQGGKK